MSLAERMQRVIRQDVQSMHAYAIQPSAGFVKLDAMENPFRLPPKLPVIQGDRDKITTAIGNLIGNALKYTPKGGEVTVTVGTAEGKLSVDVTDTGIGISEEEMRRLSRKELSRLFRRKAQEMHPDKGGDHESFITLAQAYQDIKQRKK